MYEVKKRFEISAAHKLDLDYDSKCTNFHGHNWIIDVYLQSETLDKNGMVLDFTPVSYTHLKALALSLLISF